MRGTGHIVGGKNWPRQFDSARGILHGSAGQYGRSFFWSFCASRPSISRMWLGGRNGQLVLLQSRSRRIGCQCRALVQPDDGGSSWGALLGVQPQRGVQPEPCGVKGIIGPDPGQTHSSYGISISQNEMSPCPSILDPVDVLRYRLDVLQRHHLAQGPAWQ